MRHHLARLAAAVLVTAAAGVVISAPAQAAACSGSTGVTVVVDFHELGGGVQQGCVPDGAGKDASGLFQSAGFALTRVQNQPGFVCRVSGLPADDPCVRTPPATAYWALWSSDGTSGSWDYASLGVDGLSVPDGGSVAFSWKQGSAASQPGVAPAERAAAPTPTPSATPSARATKKPITRPTVGPRGTRKPEPTPVPSSSPTTSSTPSTTPSTAPSATPSASPSETPSGSPSPTTAASPSASTSAAPAPSATPSDSVPTSAPAPADDGGGLPTWVGPVLVVLVFGAAGAVAVVRRRRTTDLSG